MDGLWGKTLLELMIWGYPYFLKNPCCESNSEKESFTYEKCEEVELSAKEGDLIHLRSWVLKDRTKLFWHQFLFTVENEGKPQGSVQCENEITIHMGK